MLAYPNDWHQEIKRLRARLFETQSQLVRKSQNYEAIEAISKRTLQRAESNAHIGSCSVHTLRQICECFRKEAGAQLHRAAVEALPRLGPDFSEQTTKSTLEFEKWKLKSGNECESQLAESISRKIELRDSAEELYLEVDRFPGRLQNDSSTIVRKRLFKWTIARTRPYGLALLAGILALLLVLFVICSPAPAVTKATIDGARVSPSACPAEHPCPFRWQSSLTLQLEPLGHAAVYLQTQTGHYYLQGGMTFTDARHVLSSLYPGTEHRSEHTIFFLYVVTRRCLEIPRTSDAQALISLPRGRVWGPLVLEDQR